MTGVGGAAAAVARRAACQPPPAVLRGLLRCKACDCPMGPTYSQKSKRAHRHYVCQQAQQQGWSSCPSKSIPAEPIERFVLEQVQREFKDFESRWALLSADERARTLGARVARVEYDGSAETVWIAFRPDPLKSATPKGEQAR